MHGRHNAHEEVEADAVALLQAWRDRLAAEPRDAHGIIWLVGKRVVQVVRELPVNRHGLEPADDSFA